MITWTMIEAAYSAAKEIYLKPHLKQKILKQLQADNWHRTSAVVYINNFRHMMQGKAYQRTFSLEAIDYYLENISRDFSLECYKNAIDATQQHFRKGHSTQTETCQDLIASHRRRYILLYDIS